MQTDEQLVSIVRTENKELYTELVKRYEEKLKRYVGYLATDNEWVDDIVQDTFIKAYKNLNSFNINKKFSSWIYRIAHNETMNKVHKERRIVNGLDLTIFEEVFGAHPEEEYEKESIKKEVLEGLEKLPLKYKEVLSLFFLEDKKYEEISDILRMSIGTIGTRINRGKKLLHKILEDSK